VQTASIPRQIPPQAWYMHPLVSAVSGGLLTFGAVFVEMFFILSSIWQHRFYYVFGFLAIVFGILLVTCVEIAIVMCYLHLCAEDYRWWWRSMITGGGKSPRPLVLGAQSHVRQRRGRRSPSLPPIVVPQLLSPSPPCTRSSAVRSPSSCLSGVWV
jgi:hypothetical protein